MVPASPIRWRFPSSYVMLLMGSSPLPPWLRTLKNRVRRVREPVPTNGLIARRTYRQQAVSYPRFRVKMFGMSVAVVRALAMSDVQVSMAILVLI